MFDGNQENHGLLVKSLFPSNLNKENYRSYFNQTDVWLPAIHEIQKRHHLSGIPSRSSLGSHVLFKIGGLWIKLMAPFYKADMAYEIEALNNIPKKFPYQYPLLLAHDFLEDWEYIIVSHVDGQPIKNIWSQLNIAQKRELSLSLGKMTLELQKLPLTSKIRQRFDWNDFIVKRFNQLWQGEKLKAMPADWQKMLPDFVSRFSANDFTTSKPVFLHGDLTYDHFLISVGSYQLNGIIDFADCQAGHPEYELVAPAVFIFRSQKELLQIFLIGAGISIEQLNQEFSEKLLVWSLLHRYFDFANAFSKELENIPAGNFPALAKLIFPLQD